MKKQNYIDYIFPLMSSTFYGLVPIIQSLALNKGTIASITIIFCYISGLVLLLTLMFVKKINFKITLRDLGLFILLGIILFCTDLLLNTTYTYINTGFATSIHFIYPTIICLCGCLFYKNKLNIKKIAGIFLSITGLILICKNQISLNPIGIVLAISSALFYSLYLMGIERFMSNKYEPIKISFYVTTISLIFSIMNIITFSGKLIFNINSIPYCIIAGIMLISGNICFNEGIKRLTAYKASFFEILEPVICVITSFVIYKDKILLLTVIGICLIILSLIPIFLDNKKN